MKVAVEASFEEMNQSVSRLRNNIRDGKGEISAAAVEAFAVMRDRMEVEVRGILTRSEGALRQLQEGCTNMTREMQRSISEAENTSRSFGMVAEGIRAEAGRISTTVAEAGQNMAATHNLLQRSQGSLTDVAQKSGEAINTFNENLSQQARSLAALQQSVSATTGQMAEADQRLVAIKNGFTSVLEDLNQRLNKSMMDLGQNILQMRSESEEAARDVTRHGQDITAQHEAIRTTAEALSKALADLEAVNRNVSRNMSDQARIAMSAARLAPMNAPPPAPRVAAAPPPRETAEETLRRLRAMGTRAPASVPPATSAAAPPPAPTPKKSDSDLIHSLTQIIQQLEDTPGGAPTDKKKAG
jgi:chromosome segregation ATPase